MEKIKNANCVTKNKLHTEKSRKVIACFWNESKRRKKTHRLFVKKWTVCLLLDTSVAVFSLCMHCTQTHKYIYVRIFWNEENMFRVIITIFSFFSEDSN